MNRWVVLLVVVSLLSVGASPLSQQLCGTLSRGTGITGGFCRSVLESVSGELPSCPNDDETVENALAIFDFFSDENLLESFPAAEKVMNRVVECAEVGTIWNSNLSLFTLPGWSGPCNDKSFFESGGNPNRPYMGFLPCALANVFGQTAGNSKYCDAASDNYQWWVSYLTFYGQSLTLNGIQTGTSFDLSLNPDCLDPQLAASGPEFNTIAANGGRPYCSFYTDLALGAPSCSEVARFRPVGFAATVEKREIDVGGVELDLPTNSGPFASDNYDFSGGYYMWEYCSSPVTVLNPWTPNRYELVTCSEWSTCTNPLFVNGSGWGYQDYLANGSFPICNPCNCGQGQFVTWSSRHTQGDDLSSRPSDTSSEKHSSSTSGRRGVRDSSCAGQGDDLTFPVGTSQQKHTGGGRAARDLEENCGGQGGDLTLNIINQDTTTKHTGGAGRSVKSRDTAAELFELLAQLHIETALQADQPWQEILGRMCSCACGPAF